MNRKLVTAQAYYRMANKLRARGFEIETAGWEDERNKYDAYIASITTPEQRSQWIVHSDVRQAGSEPCSI